MALSPSCDYSSCRVHRNPMTPAAARWKGPCSSSSLLPEIGNHRREGGGGGNLTSLASAWSRRHSKRRPPVPPRLVHLPLVWAWQALHQDDGASTSHSIEPTQRQRHPHTLNQGVFTEGARLASTVLNDSIHSVWYHQMTLKKSIRLHWVTLKRNSIALKWVIWKWLSYWYIFLQNWIIFPLILFAIFMESLSMYFV